MDRLAFESDRARQFAVRTKRWLLAEKTTYFIAD